MKHKKDLYLFVNSNEISEVRYNFINNNELSSRKRIVIPKFNIERKNINSDFVFLDIPMEYRKIVIKLLSNLKESEEYITRIPFDISEHVKITNDEIKERIDGFYNRNNIVFSTDANFVSHEDVHNFYLSLLEKGLFDEYVNSLNRLFMINIKEKNANAVLKKIKK